MASRPLALPGRNWINLGMALANLGAFVVYMASNDYVTGLWCLAVSSALSFAKVSFSFFVQFVILPFLSFHFPCDNVHFCSNSLRFVCMLIEFPCLNDQFLFIFLGLAHDSINWRC
jgi:hypothetical protein